MKDFQRAIQQNLEESPFYEYVQRVIDVLKAEKIKVYFWGGAVRDPIVDVLYEYGEEPAVIMCRLILHGNKLGFEIGQKGRRFIIERYSSDQDGIIKKYLEYKKLEGLSSFVIGKLKRIQKER